QLLESLKNEHLLNPQQKEPKKYLTVDEVCEEYGFKKPTLYALTSKQLISYLKPGKTLMFLRSDVENYIEASRRKTKAQLKQEFEDSFEMKTKKGLNYEK
ncbi:MAG: helix-turn-helix domain-containing protein, partial [Bacteroidota bacterium]|nr:helix-turn-helix domain-containing protein [Bacteroidota bacterium]